MLTQKIVNTYIMVKNGVIRLNGTKEKPISIKSISEDGSESIFQRKSMNGSGPAHVPGPEQSFSLPDFKNKI